MHKVSNWRMSLSALQIYYSLIVIFSSFLDGVRRALVRAFVLVLRGTLNTLILWVFKGSLVVPSKCLEIWRDFFRIELWSLKKFTLYAVPFPAHGKNPAYKSLVMRLRSSLENLKPSDEATLIICSGLTQLLNLSCIIGFNSISLVKAINAL